MRWTVHSEKPLYTDPWLDIRLADVELPDGRHLKHRLIRTSPGAGAVVTDGAARVLLLWRHRFITGTWGWEIPIGKADPGEDPAASAAREVEEETGWRPGPLRPLLQVEPSPGISDSVHHIFRADTASKIGAPEDDFESSRIEWVDLYTVPDLIGRGQITSGTTLAALLYTIAREQLADLRCPPGSRPAGASSFAGSARLDAVQAIRRTHASAARPIRSGILHPTQPHPPLTRGRCRLRRRLPMVADYSGTNASPDGCQPDAG